MSAVKTAKNPVLSRALALALADFYQNAQVNPAMGTPRLHLFTAGPNPPTPNSVKADFTEATFNGYASFPLVGTFVGPVNTPSGSGVALTMTRTFIAGSGFVTPGETILGWWIDNNSTTLYLSERFDAGVPIAAAGDFLTLEIFAPIDWQPVVS